MHHDCFKHCRSVSNLSCKSMKNVIWPSSFYCFIKHNICLQEFISKFNHESLMSNMVLKVKYSSESSWNKFYMDKYCLFVPIYNLYGFIILFHLLVHGYKLFIKPCTNNGTCTSHKFESVVGKFVIVNWKYHKKHWI